MTGNKLIDTYIGVGIGFIFFVIYIILGIIKKDKSIENDKKVYNNDRIPCSDVHNINDDIE